MELKVRRNLQRQILKLKAEIHSLDMYYKNPNAPFIRPIIDQVMQFESVNEKRAIEIIVQLSQKNALERIAQLEALLRKGLPDGPSEVCATGQDV
jgi:hypothetical protein